MRAAILITLLGLGACSRVASTCESNGGSGGQGGNVACALTECDPDAANADKATCSDSDPTTADRCIPTSCGAACAHIRVECDGADESSVQAAICDDGDPCTNDRCLVSACAHTPFISPDCPFP